MRKLFFKQIIVFIADQIVVVFAVGFLVEKSEMTVERVQLLAKVFGVHIRLVLTKVVDVLRRWHFAAAIRLNKITWRFESTVVLVAYEYRRLKEVPRAERGHNVLSSQDVFRVLEAVDNF